jgi:peroxiredoxin
MTQKLPNVKFTLRENGEFVETTTAQLFYGKRVVLFSLPGAFTPTCSTYQLPGFEEKYDEFTSVGIDAIYCISVNDAFVMNAWAKDQGIEKVKLIPDGNGEFTEKMGMLVEKSNIGFGKRSWRYAAIVENGFVEFLTEESGKEDNCALDPYEATTPEKLLLYAQSFAVQQQEN